MVKIEVSDAGLPNRPQMQSPLHNRRIQRIGLFTFLFLTVTIFGLYNRASWPGTDLSALKGQTKESTQFATPATESPGEENKVVPQEITVEPIADKPNTPPTTPSTDSPGSAPAIPESSPSSKVESTKPASQTPAKTPADAGLDQTRVALIIETRPISHLPALLSSFIANLPAEWIVKHVGDTPAFDLLKSHNPLRRHIDSGKLQLVPLPDEYNTKNNEALSAVFTNITFYRDFLAPAEWILMFQTDSMICSGHEKTLNDYVELGYDWWGAPWHPKRMGGNGGLSLRNVPSIIKVLEKETRKPDASWEDVWLCERLGNAAPPKLEEAFSVESLWHPAPFGYHIRGSGKLPAADVWQNRTRRRHIFDYCPEVKLIMGNVQLESSHDEDWRLQDLGQQRLPTNEEKAKELAQDLQYNPDVHIEPVADMKAGWIITPAKEKATESVTATASSSSAMSTSTISPSGSSAASKTVAENTLPTTINADGKSSFGEADSKSKSKPTPEEEKAADEAAAPEFAAVAKALEAAQQGSGAGSR